VITTFGSILRFVLVGGSNTLVGLAVIVLAIRLFGMNDVAANAIGYVIGFSWSFGLNRRWTFRHSGAPTAALGRYALVCALSYALNVVVLMGMRSALPTAHVLPQLAAVITYSVAAYLGSRYFAFRTRTVSGVAQS
jgi:putative flippase GtrA